MCQAFPPVIFGTSGLGNLYEALSDETKLAVVKACVDQANGKLVFDTAGKYGAGLALASLGKCLAKLGVDPADVWISNKLGWYQIPLTTSEPTFEPGVWKQLEQDAVQKINYEGIVDCFHQGNQLLGNYSAQWVSVHDPDEYLAKAINKKDEAQRYQDILEAYRALAELKMAGKVSGVGVGAKQWNVIERIAKDVVLDWVMIANSLTLHNHPPELIRFIASLQRKGIMVINSAVFNGGFLVGSDYYNYQLVDKNLEEGQQLYVWRRKFWKLCRQFHIQPAEACFNFGFHVPGICSVALNTTKPEKVALNVQMATRVIPHAFWQAMIAEGLITENDAVADFLDGQSTY